MEFVRFLAITCFPLPRITRFIAGAVRLRSIATIAAVTFGVLAVPFATPALAQAGDARIRLAHFSPDANGVDVYIDGKKRMNRVPYQAVSDYITVPAGKHTIEVRGEGQAETSPALVTASPELAGGESFTAAALGPVANIQAKVFADDLTPPAAGKSKIRVIHAADGTPTVDIAVKDGDVLFPAVEFGAITTYVEVASGPYVLQVRKAGDAVAAIEKPVTVQPGGVYTIAAVGGADKPATLRGFVDLAAKAGNAAATTAGTTALAPVSTDASPTDSTPADSTPPAPSDSTPAGTKAAAPTATEPAEVEPTATVPPTKAPVTPTTVPAAVGGGKTPIGGANSNSAANNSGANNDGGTGAGGGKASGATGSKPGAGSNAGKVPVGGAKTGFGGLSNTSSAISGLALMGAFLAIVVAGLRRRNTQY
jgi:Domain of unknown function (DUF4397)